MKDNDYRTHLGLKRSEVGMGGPIWPLIIVLLVIAAYVLYRIEG